MEQSNTPTATTDPAPVERLLRRADVADLTSIKANSTLYDMIRRGEFPAPIKLGRSSAWRESEVRQWIAARPAAQVRSVAK